MKLNLTTILLILIAGLIIFGFIKRSFYLREIRDLEKEITYQEELVKHKEGQYSKIMSEYEDQKVLFSMIKLENSELAERLEEKNEKVLQLQQLKLDFKSQVDTVYQTDSVLVKTDSTTEIDTYYPRRDLWFVHYNGLIKGNRLVSSWRFNSLYIDIAVTETGSGQWRANLNAPSFVKLDSFSVSRLDNQNIIKQDNFGWLAGVGLENDFTVDRKIPISGIPVTGGVRYKNNYLLVDLSAPKRLGVRFLKEF